MKISIKERIWAERDNITEGRTRSQRDAFYTGLFRAQAKKRREDAVKKGQAKPLTKDQARNLASLQLARKLKFSGKTAKKEAWANLKKQWALEDALGRLNSEAPAVIFGE